MDKEGTVGYGGNSWIRWEQLDRREQLDMEGTVG